MRTPPYRFVAVEGMYAGTTFVYPDDDTVISYRTAEPDHYFRTPYWRTGKNTPVSSRHIMTDADLARFNSYPEET